MAWWQPQRLKVAIFKLWTNENALKQCFHMYYSIHHFIFQIEVLMAKAGMSAKLFSAQVPSHMKQSCSS